MARTGFFSGPSTPYGQPLSIVQPTDNVFQPAGTAAAPVASATTTASTDLQAQITAFYDFLRTARTAATTP